MKNSNTPGLAPFVICSGCGDELPLWTQERRICTCFRTRVELGTVNLSG